MKPVVQAKCPGCQRPLRIPAAWAGQTMRCKHCGHVMEARKRRPALNGTVPGTQAATVPGVPAAVAYDAPLPGRPVRPVPAAEEEVEEVAETLEPVPTAAPVPAPPRGPGYTPAFNTASKYRNKGRYRRPGEGGGVGKWAAAALVLLLLGGGTTLVFVNPFRKSPPGDSNKDVAQGGPKGGNTDPNGSAIPVAAGPFPRRMLAISVNNYLYANPVSYGQADGDRNDVHGALMKVADRWRIPRDQVYEVTDGASGDAPRSPFKDVIVKTIERFCETSRPQDRILFVYTGHAVEKDGEAFLVPIEGELDEPGTLIPLKDVYEKLGKCPAQQKLVVFDVCRYNGDRGADRPGAGPMTEGLEKALHSPPPGVAVWTSCSAGQNSYEYDYLQWNGPIYGGVFLSEFLHASIAGVLSKGGKKGGIQSPDEPLPYKPLVEFVSKETADAVRWRESNEKKEQTPKFTEAEWTAVAYNPGEPPPARFELPKPPPIADRKEIASIFKEIGLPPIKAVRADVPEQRLDKVFPFTAESLKDYQDDGVTFDEIKKSPDKYPLRVAVVEAVEEMRKLQGDSSNQLRESFDKLEVNDAIKGTIRMAQRVPAVRMAVMQEQLEKLTKAGANRDKEKSKRWQADYDYVLANVKMRIAYLYEYNFALGKIVEGADRLPELTGDQKGWRLAAEEKLVSGKEARDLVDEARETLTKLAADHPNTPWALLGKQERNTRLGLRWRAYSSAPTLTSPGN